jgi:hypothetical protein
MFFPSLNRKIMRGLKWEEDRHDADDRFEDDEDRVVSDKIQELNDQIYGLSEIFGRSFPNDNDSAPVTSFLYNGWRPRSMIYDEEGQNNNFLLKCRS